MAKRLNEDVKIEIAQRAKKEDIEGLASEYGIAVSTVNDYAKTFGNRRPKRKGVKRSVKPEDDSGTLISELRHEAEFWKSKFIELFYERNRR